MTMTSVADESYDESNYGKFKLASENLDNGTIHSGHFMVSSVHDHSEEKTTHDIFTSDSENSNIEENNKFQPKRNVAPKEDQVSKQIKQVNLSNGISIDGSLTSLFNCMTLAYVSGKLTSPRWKNFKGVKLHLKEKIRLNNIIWREWYMQYKAGLKPIVCSFEPPISDKTHTKPEAVVLEGKYWKRRLECVTAEYKKWRLFYKEKSPKEKNQDSWLQKFFMGAERLFSNKDDNLNDKESSLAEDDFMDFSDTLFTTLNQSSFMFPNPKEMCGQLSNSDFIQPGLIQLQPSLDDFMDTLETIPNFHDVLSSNTKTGSLSSLNESTINHRQITEIPLENVSSPENQNFTSFQSNSNFVIPVGTTTNISSDNFQQDLGTNPSILTQPSVDFQSTILVSQQKQQVDAQPVQHLLPQPVGTLLPLNQIQDNPMLISQVPLSFPPNPILQQQVNLQQNYQQQPQQQQHNLAAEKPLSVTVIDQSIISRSNLSFTNSVINSSSNSHVINLVLNTNSGKPTTFSVVPSTHTTFWIPPPIVTNKTMSLVNTSNTLSNSNVVFSSQRPNKVTQNVILKNPSIKPNSPSLLMQALNQPLSSNQKNTPPNEASNLLNILREPQNLSTSVSSNQISFCQEFQVPKVSANYTISSVPVKKDTTFQISQDPIFRSTKMKPIAPAIAKVNSLNSSQNHAHVKLLQPLSDIKVENSEHVSKTGSHTASKVLVPQPKLIIDLREVETSAQTCLFNENNSFYTNADVFSQSQSNSPLSPRLDSPLSMPPYHLESDRLQCTEVRKKIHISAEKKRRCHIKNGLEILHQIVPSLSNIPSAKISKAATLQRGAEFLRKLKADRIRMQEEADILRHEIESLNTKISTFQAQLPATGVPNTRQRSDQLREMFDEYVRDRTLKDWKFYIFSLIIRPLFESYTMVASTSNLEELCRTVLSWLDQHCSLVVLRPGVLGSLRQLCTSTSILSNPSDVPNEAITITQKFESLKSNHHS